MALLAKCGTKIHFFCNHFHFFDALSVFKLHMNLILINFTKITLQ